MARYGDGEAQHATDERSLLAACRPVCRLTSLQPGLPHKCSMHIFVRAAVPLLMQINRWHLSLGARPPKPTRGNERSSLGRRLCDFIA
jgi:hypothetical protein